jgi:hypothetical protein
MSQHLGPSRRTAPDSRLSHRDAIEAVYSPIQRRNQTTDERGDAHGTENQPYEEGAIGIPDVRYS